jgi:acetyltransferase-like isoleucine patch superfamily enzyme
MTRLKLAARLWGGRVEAAGTVRLRTRVVFRGTGTLRIGDHAILGDPGAGLPGAPMLFHARGWEARIEIGAGSRLANGVEMIAVDLIEIGAGVLVGAGVRIVDSDFHGIAPEERMLAGRSGPVRIADGAWLGMSSMVLKGVSIGVAAVVGAGSVVVRDVPAGAVVSGNPARMLAMYAEI